MWDSGVPGFTDTTGKAYNLHDYTAYQGDLLASLKTECEARGVRFGLYYSILDWNHPSQTDRGGLTTMSSLADRTSYIADMKAQLQELLDRYDPAVLWFDGDWFGELYQPHPERLVAQVRRSRPLQLADRPQAWPHRERARQAQPRPRRLHVPGADRARGTAVPALGDLRHHERRLGLQLRLGELLPVRDGHRPRAGHRRLPGRQLPAQHRPQGRRHGHPRLRDDPAGPRLVDVDLRRQRPRYDRQPLYDRPLLGPGHEEGRHAVRPRLQLARERPTPDPGPHQHHQPGLPDEQPVGLAAVHRQQRPDQRHRAGRCAQRQRLRGVRRGHRCAREQCGRRLRRDRLPGHRLRGRQRRPGPGELRRLPN